MNKLSTRKIIFPILLAAVLLLPKSALAGNLINVTFQSNPSLFGEANFLPGDSVTKWTKVSNISAFPVSITAIFLNYSDPDEMGGQYDVAIKKHNAAENIFTGTMDTLNSSGGVLLDPALAANSETQYDFAVAFKPAAGNEYQNKSLKFDFAISASSQSGGEVEIFGGTDGGGGSGGGGSFVLPAPSSAGSGQAGGGNTGGGLAFEQPGTVAGAENFNLPKGRIDGGAFTFAQDSGGPEVAESQGDVLGASTIAPEGQSGAGQCSPSYWWWYLGYLVFALLLLLTLWLERRLSKLLAYVIPVILLAAGILWWWFEPCPGHWLMVPFLMIVYFLALAFWHYFQLSRVNLPPA